MGPSSQRRRTLIENGLFVLEPFLPTDLCILRRVLAFLWDRLSVWDGRRVSLAVRVAADSGAAGASARWSWAHFLLASLYFALSL